MEKSTPLPVRATATTAAVPLRTESVPVRAPTTLGVKITEIVQVDFAASEAPQVVVSEKSPVMTIPVIAATVAVLFVMVRT